MEDNEEEGKKIVRRKKKILKMIKEWKVSFMEWHLIKSARLGGTNRPTTDALYLPGNRKRKCLDSGSLFIYLS